MHFRPHRIDLFPLMKHIDKAGPLSGVMGMPPMISLDLVSWNRQVGGRYARAACVAFGPHAIVSWDQIRVQVRRISHQEVDAGLRP